VLVISIRDYVTWSRFVEECLKPVDLPGRGVPSRIIQKWFSSKIGGPTPVGKVHPTLTVVPGDGSGHEAGKDGSSLIDEIVREGARRMLAEALQGSR
jgi:hypothetical protein